MEKIDLKLTDSLYEQAVVSLRNRKNLNFHKDEQDPVQRMLNAFGVKTYVQPHVHLNPDKREVFVILTGRLLVFFFDDNGKITDHVILDREAGVFGVEIAPGEWHTATALVEGTVVYEIKDGPYNPLDDKNFALWAPKENDPEAAIQMETWLSELEISI